MDKKFIFVLSFFLTTSLLFAQKKFTKKESDSVLSKLQYLKIKEEDSKKAIEEINTVLPKLNSDSARIILIRQKAYLYSRLRDEPNVLKTYLQSKDLVDKMGSERESVMYHLALAEVYSHLKMFNLSLKNLEDANNLMRSPSKVPKDPMHRLAYTALKLNALFESRDYKNCIKFGKEILPEFQTISNVQQKTFMTMLANQLIAFSYLELQDYAHVQPYLKNAIALDKNQIYEFQLKNNTAFGRFLFETGKTDSALIVLNDFKIKEKQSYPDVVATRSNLFAKIYVAKNRPELSEAHLNKKDSLERETQALEVNAAEVSVRHVEQEKDKTIESKNSLIYYLLLPLILLSVGLVSVLVYRKKNEKEKYQRIINRLRNERNDVNRKNIDGLSANSENVVEDSQKTKIIVSQNSSLADVKEKELLEGLAKFELKEKYRDMDLSLASMATYLKTNRTYLSEVIKKYKAKNYNSYINELRINYIVHKLYNESEYLNYKISYLAEDCGFVSHSSFATIFKSVLGISPSAFIQNLKEDHNK
ncbi:helix-turn-helix domain-containing protein [Soonwooa sp.]|uniref:helix-turn-helix domain-containing protein n=1 Tax=Soonwooa sp. TaxID=1938592 RepID=UPI00260B64F3|nr:helix-turn-helix domain-containing protein [Soonwooa sp.]